MSSVGCTGVDVGDAPGDAGGTVAAGAEADVVGGLVLVVVCFVLCRFGGGFDGRGGASDLPSDTGSDDSPIGWDTSLLAEYVTPATRTRPTIAIAIVPVTRGGAIPGDATGASVKAKQRP